TRRRTGLNVALLQEARRPLLADGRVLPEPGDADAWRIAVPIGTKRGYTSSVVCFNDDWQVEPVLPTPLADSAYGQFASSHPGQFRVARITPIGGPTITVVSLYGLWESDGKFLYSEGTLHRAISDLAPI